eukprot:TRINITY_DN14979_c0_g3_i1.p3 TRINITY_DN14979_c0_g3~~TRINITY_DN14979_c0_g3_i1.p3  ORF type:complete len:103 (-),score=8.79 TRINITY_DN14979_c0_g3_i1:800-1108(-)
MDSAVQQGGIKMVITGWLHSRRGVWPVRQSGSLEALDAIRRVQRKGSLTSPASPTSVFSASLSLPLAICSVAAAPQQCSARHLFIIRRLYSRICEAYRSYCC